VSDSFWAATLGSAFVLICVSVAFPTALPVLASWWAVGVLLIGMIDLWANGGPPDSHV
jgi:hypothetical protein